jgi:hypothetical protein
MAHAGKSEQTVVVSHPVKVTVKTLKIKRAESLKYLDVAKLGKAAKAEFDLGHVKTDKCESTVRAIVRKGMVVGIRTECCNCESEKIPSEALDLIKAVARKVTKGGGGPFRPVSVAAFLQQQGPVIETSKCHLFCFWGMCFVCCGFPSDSGSWGCTRIGGRSAAKKQA